MIKDSPMNMLDSENDTEFDALFPDGLVVELWVEVGPSVDDKVGPAVEDRAGLVVENEVGPVVDERIVLVADGILEDELALVGPVAPY
jgi:hypothetical protein